MYEPLTDGMFIEFFEPVFFDGIGYVDSVALCASMADNKRPAVVQCDTLSAAVVLVVKNGARACVSNANIKFTAYKRVTAQGQVNSAEKGVPSPSATPSVVQSNKGAEDGIQAAPSDEGSVAPSPHPSPKKALKRPRGAW